MFYLTSYERRVLIFILIIIFFGSILHFLNIKRFLENRVSLNHRVSLDQRININTATYQELKAIPYIGEKLAFSIIEYRNNFGKFNSLEDLRKVKGIKDKKLNIIKEYIKF